MGVAPREGELSREKIKERAEPQVEGDKGEGKAM